jgi:hypothetical protein
MHNHQRLILCNTNEHTAIFGFIFIYGKRSVESFTMFTSNESQQVQIKNVLVVKEKEPVHQTIGIQWISSVNIAARPVLLAVICPYS